jgi:hypothetical protein
MERIVPALQTVRQQCDEGEKWFKVNLWNVRHRRLLAGLILTLICVSLMLGYRLSKRNGVINGYTHKAATAAAAE